MLEEVKEVFISNIQKELAEKQEVEDEIDKEIEHMSKKRIQKQEESALILSNLNQQIQELNRKLLQRIFGSQRLTNLCNEYTAANNSAIEEIKLIDEKIESLYQQLYHLAYDKVSIDKKLEGVKKATSLQELGLNEKQALDYIKDNEKKVVRAVFRDIQKQKIETSTDIDRNMNTLYQANISPFVVAMQNMNIGDLIKELVDIGIIVDQDKIEYIGKINNYISNMEKLLNSSNISNPKSIPYPDIQGKERTDRLDHNFYNQVQQDLSHMDHYHSYPPLAVSKIVTLAVLVSMAKENKRERQRMLEEEAAKEEKKGQL